MPQTVDVTKPKVSLGVLVNVSYCFNTANN